MKLSILAALSVVNGQAADINWQGGTADYNVPTNWVGGVVPGSADNAINDNTSNNVVLIKVGDPDWTLNDIRAGNGAGDGAWQQNGQTVTLHGWFRLGVAAGDTGIYTLNGGTINYNGGDFNVGELGTGVLNINGGTITGSGNFADNLGGSANVDVVNQTAGAVDVTGGGQLFVGNNGTATYNLSGGTIDVHNYIAFGRSGGNGTFNMTGGTLNQDGGGNLLVGTGYQAPSGGSAVGLLVQSAGTINCQGQFLVPESSPSTGTYQLSGTGQLNCNNWIAIGRNGASGELDLSGGVISKTDGNGDHIDIGAGGPGVINQTGGVITNTTSDFWLAENNTATWNLESGSAYLGNIIICQSTSAQGTLNLDGGLLQTLGISSSQGGNAYSIVSLNGGTLQASANNPNFVANIYQLQASSGGAVIDSQAYDITIPQPLVDNAGGVANVTKLGSGALILAGANSFGGNTTVSGGVLEVNTLSSSSGAVTAANGAGYGALVGAANSQLTVSSLTIGGANGGSLVFDLGSFGNPGVAPLNVSGAFTANGAITVNVAASVIATGTIPLLQYASIAGTQNFVLGTLPSGVVATLATANNTLELVVTSAGAPRWDGSATGDWDLGSNLDWVDIATSLPTTYVDGRPVVFDDNASGTTTVNLTAAVTPATITFNNNNLPYTLVGNGQIKGSTGLNLNGAANVAILNTGGNSFTGPVVVKASQLTVTNLANGGSPSALGASSASATNLVVVDGALSYGGAPVAVNRGFTIGGTNCTIDTEGNLALGGQITAIANVTDGGSALTKVGPAQLAITGSGDNEFSKNYDPGLRVVAGTMVFDGSAGGQTNHVASEMWVGCTVTNGAALVLTNTTLNVDNWFGLGRINGGINNTSTVTLYNSALSVGNLSLGWDGGLGNNLAEQLITLNGNSALTNYGSVNLGESAGSSFVLSVSNNSIFHVQNPVYICLGGSTTGSVVVANSGQIIQTGGWFDIAQGANSLGSLLLKDNASVSADGDFNLGDTGSGANATFTAQDNSVLHANNLYVGKAASSIGTFNINNSATVVSGNGLTLTPASGSTATVNLNGGSLSVNLVQGNTDASTLSTFNFNGGTLIAHGPFYSASLMFNLSAINVLAGGAIIDSGTNTIAIDPALLGDGNGGGLTKVGSGTLNLDGTETYTGTTLVSAGTLSGTGAIAGPVNVASGATLGAGNGAIGTLTINNALTLSAGSTAFLKITPSSNDQIAGLTAVTYGGTLVVSNTSGSTLPVGGTFQLFHSAVAGSGNFASVKILPSGAGTFNPATGILTITQAGGITFNGPAHVGGNLVLTGVGGAAGGTYSLLSSTNVAAPLATWTTNSTGVFDNSGAFSNSIPVTSTNPAQYFLIKTP